MLEKKKEVKKKYIYIYIYIHTHTLSAPYTHCHSACSDYFDTSHSLHTHPLFYMLSCIPEKVGIKKLYFCQK